MIVNAHNFEVEGGSVGDGTPDLVSEKRGEWGDLWR